VKIPWHESSVEVPSGATRVLARGEGPALIWSHGLLHPIALEEHTPLREFLGGMHGRRVIRYDARGHGGSAAGRSDAANRWDRLGADLLDLADALGIERFVAAGASMGVAASLHATLSAPERIAALLLVIPPTAWESRPAQAGLYRGMAELLERSGTGAVAQAVAVALRGQPVAPGFESAEEALLEALRGWDPPALGHVLRGAAESDLPDRERLEEIDAPALIVAVRDDPGHPLSTAEELAERLPRAQLHVVGSLAEVDEIRTAATRFLAEIATTGC
jgi:pimeloyl-ACP methyl ester carboxylesterase